MVLYDIQHLPPLVLLVPTSACVLTFVSSTTDVALICQCSLLMAGGSPHPSFLLFGTLVDLAAGGHEFVVNSPSFK